MIMPFRCGSEDICVIVLRTSEGDASETKGNNPSPYSLLIEGPPPEVGGPKSGEEEQNSSRSSFNSLARLFASDADRKSNHGFAELDGGCHRPRGDKKGQIHHFNREYMRAVKKAKGAPHD